MKIKRTTYFKIIAVSISLIMTLFLLDAFYNVKKEIVDKNDYNAYNDSINKAHYDFASKNPYGFTDKVRKKEKPDSVYRVAVIGDSFIWGDGLPIESVWSHKLERKIDEQYKNVELMSWGKNGWSTLDEYNFFIENGHQYKIDLLIFGFVYNDLDMGDYKHMNPLWYNRLGFMFKILPRLTRAVMDYLYNDSYSRWMNKLYTEKNLNKYQDLLYKVKDLEQKYAVKIAFVHTPNMLNDDFKEMFPKVEPLLNKANLKYINLYPIMEEKFSGVSPDSLKANPANPHPGDKLTAFYADEVLKFILQNGYIDSVFLKK